MPSTPYTFIEDAPEIFIPDEQDQSLLTSEKASAALDFAIPASIAPISAIASTLTNPAVGISAGMGRRQIQKERLQSEMHRAQTEGWTGEMGEKALGGAEAIVGTAAEMEPFNLLRRTLRLPQQITGGPQYDIKPAISPEQARKAVDFLDPLPNEAGSLREGVKEFAADTLSSFTSLDQFAALLLGKTHPRMVARQFQLQAAATIPSAAQQLQEAIQSGDRTAVGKAGAALAASVAIPAAIEKGIRNASNRKSIPVAVAGREPTRPAAQVAERIAEDVQKAAEVKAQEAEQKTLSLEEREFELLREHWLPTIKPWRREFLDKAVNQGLGTADIDTNFQDSPGARDVIRARRYYELARKLYGRVYGEKIPTAEPTPKLPKEDVAPQDLRPAVAITDTPTVGQVGESHGEILEQAGVPPKEIPHEDPRRGFVDVNNPEVLLDRDKAEQIAGVEGTAKAGGLDSQDLKKIPETPATFVPDKPIEQPAPIPSDASPTQSAPTTEAGKTVVPESPTSKQQGIVGMGGAVVGEIPETGAGGEKYGIAERVREERAKAGQVAPVEPGQGISTPDSIERGREIIRTDPNAAEKLMSAFESDPAKNISADGMAVARAHGEALAAGARTIEEQFGTDSDQYRAAFKALSDWDKRSKRMQTEWHKTGMAQQGETDIDTGSFTGLQRAFNEYSGENFSPDQVQKAKKVAKKSKEFQDSANQAVEKLNKLFERKKTTNAEKDAIDAVNKTLTNAAERVAKAETKARVAEEVRKQAEENVQKLSKEDAETKTTDTKRKAAIRGAKAQAAERLKQATRDKKIADVQLKAEKDATDAVNKRVTKASAKAAELERKQQDNPIRKVWNSVTGYLEKGDTDPNRIRTKVAKDLGLTTEKVYRLLAQDERAKHLMDDMWLKQQAARRIKENAKRWVASLDEPKFRQYLETVPDAMFKAKVWGHAAVALGTHAPAVGWQVRYWNTFSQNYAKMWKLALNPATYERMKTDLENSQNFVKAQRFGLKNQFDQHEEINAPALVKFTSDRVGMGSRGYSILKFMRQDLFDHIWNNLPKTEQIDEVGWMIANRINHITGTLSDVAPPKSLKGRIGADMKAPAGASTVGFAPTLLLSRARVLFRDPAQSLMILTHWNKATPGEKIAVKMDIADRAWATGTMLALLGLNAGLLAASGSKQKINFTDPTRSDWMKFKAMGMDFAFGNAMISMGRFPLRAIETIKSESGRGKAMPDESIYTATGQFLRSQLSPFMGTTADLAMGMDYARRPLPRKLFGLMPQHAKVPMRLSKEGVKPYTWGEYSLEQAAPIPFQEGVKEAWKYGWGMSDVQIKSYLKAIAISSIMGSTGGRLSEDYDLKKNKPLQMVP